MKLRGGVLLLKNLFFTLLVPGTVAGWIPLWFLRGDQGLAEGPLALIGWLVLSFGFAIYTWCIWDFASFGQPPSQYLECGSWLEVDL